MARTKIGVQPAIDELYGLFDGLSVDLSDIIGDILGLNIRVTSLEANPEGHVIEDEGAPVTQRTNLNFVGAGVTVSDFGGKTRVSIPGGGGGGASAATVETDLGAAAFRGTFTITDAAIDASSKVLVWQAPGPYTGKGTRADEAEAQPVNVIYVEPAVGSALVMWETPPIYAEISAGLSPGSGGGPNNVIGAGAQRREHDIIIRKRRGLVKGNVKFHYVVFS